MIGTSERVTTTAECRGASGAGADLTIGTPERTELAQIVGVIARGMRDNPVHIAAFGDDPARRVRRISRLFNLVLPTVGTSLLTARRADGTIVGVLGMAPPGRCQPTMAQNLSLLPRMVGGIGPGATVRALRWVGAWGALDLAEPHWHLGPVAVDAGVQGQGIGSRLLERFCARMDAEQATAYLETDKPINVRFYERFGFRVVGELEVLGQPNWFMRRAANAGG